MRNDSTRPVFKLSELAEEYKDHLKELGTECNYNQNTRLREKLLSECPELETTSSESGSTSLITFKEDVDSVIKSECHRNYDEEGFILSQAADIIRKDLFTRSLK